MEKYNPTKLEAKWQKIWEDQGTYKADLASTKPKYIAMSMFNYPSGAGIHIGHAMNYTISDVLARFKRQQGYESYHPVGWDAFGLPAENYAIKSGISPQASMKKIIPDYHKQYKAMGWSNDWGKEISTHEPSYYKWTQWIFSEMYRQGLAYQDSRMQWWCDIDNTVLADEQITADGKCWRHDAPDDPVVEKKEIKQWFFKISDYAEELLQAIEDLDWTESVKEMQRNWIGKSQGAEVKFKLAGPKKVLVATNNPSKVERIRKVLKNVPGAPELITPAAAGLEPIHVKEGSDLVKNAINKAKAYAGQTELPILATDTGLFIENENHDPAKVRRNALQGKNEKSLSPDEQARLMIEHYQTIAKRHQDKAEGYWLDVFALLSPDGEVQTSQSRRDIILTSKIRQPIDKFFPVRSLYVNKSTGKYAADQTPEEELGADLLPYTTALEQLLAPAVTVFTTRPDTLFGATFLVLAPEHELVDKLVTPAHRRPIREYREEVAKKSDVQRQTAKHKSGVFTGSYAFNPVNNERIPIWVADYVLMTYGTGAIMAVPAHDQRDYDFAQKYKLPVIWVYDQPGVKKDDVYSGEGTMKNSQAYNGTSTQQARKRIVGDLAKRGLAHQKVNYKLRDWSVSRQRYWGAPIPIIDCQKCGPVLVPDEDLPVILPELSDFKPSGDGRSALARATDWLKVSCPSCGGEAERETDTLDTYIDSSWYMLRYIDPHNQTRIFDSRVVNKWLPIDFYNGADHATAHMIYARFITRFFHKQGLVNQPEPFKKFLFNGKVVDSEGQMFSKSKGNAPDPLDIINSGYGADALRTYLMFAAPLEQWVRWDEQGIAGTFRFLTRVWNLNHEFLKAKADERTSQAILKLIHPVIVKVTADIEHQRYNTAIAAMMEVTNRLYQAKSQGGFRGGKSWRWALEALTQLLAPFAPYIAEELWQQFGHQDTIHIGHWPQADKKYLGQDTVTVIIQVNGKMRSSMSVTAGLSEDELTKRALADKKTAKYIQDRKIVKTIVVKDKLVNFVTS